MKVRYVGPSGDGVEVIHPDPSAPDANTATVCLPGEVVDLPEDVALSGMVVGNFEPADTKAERALARHRAAAAAAAGEDETPTQDEAPAEPGTQED